MPGAIQNRKIRIDLFFRYPMAPTEQRMEQRPSGRIVISNQVESLSAPGLDFFANPDRRGSLLVAPYSIGSEIDGKKHASSD